MAEVIVNLGTNVASAEAEARSLAQQVYKALPIGDPRGQAGKHAFITELLDTSRRCRKAADVVLGNGGEMLPVDEEEAEEPSCCTCCK